MEITRLLLTYMPELLLLAQSRFFRFVLGFIAMQKLAATR